MTGSIGITEEQLDTLGKRWTKRNGEVRWYVNDWMDAIGMEVQYYKTGNVADVYYHGGNGWHGENHPSNSWYKRYVQDTKVWIDAEGSVHVDYCKDEGVERDIIRKIGERIQNAISGAAVLCQRVIKRGAKVLKPIAGAWDRDTSGLAGVTADLITKINDNDANAERSYWYVRRADGKIGELNGPWETFHGEKDLWQCIELMYPQSYDCIQPDMIEAEPVRMRFDERFSAGPRGDADLKEWIIEGKAKGEEE